MRAETRRWLILIAALLTMALTARLGFWQLDRAREKLSLQAERDAAAQLPPLTDKDWANAQPQRSFKATGRWREQAQFWLGNRPHEGQVGFILLTPLELADGSLLWVQRGWHPRASKAFEAPPFPRTEPGPVAVQGRLSRHASRAFELGAPASGVVRQNLDPAQPVQAGTPQQAWVLWQTGACEPLRCDWPAAELGVAKHHGYAFQWFALSFLTLGLYVWFQLIPRKSPRARDAA
jgi:surfeit locus 1 family protein